MVAGEPVIRAREVRKHFGRVRALDGVDIEMFSGEIVAIIGDNGAGKSTLAAIVSGVLKPDGGWVEIGGERLHRADPRIVNEKGVDTVYQTLALGPDLSILDNMYLGRELVARSPFTKLLGTLDRKAMARQCESELKLLGWDGPASVAPCAGTVGRSTTSCRCGAFNALGETSNHNG